MDVDGAFREGIEDLVPELRVDLRGAERKTLVGPSRIDLEAFFLSAVELPPVGEDLPLQALDIPVVFKLDHGADADDAEDMAERFDEAIRVIGLGF